METSPPPPRAAYYLVANVGSKFKVPLLDRYDWDTMYELERILRSILKVGGRSSWATSQAFYYDHMGRSDINSEASVLSSGTSKPRLSGNLSVFLAAWNILKMVLEIMVQYKVASTLSEFFFSSSFFFPSSSSLIMLQACHPFLYSSYPYGMHVVDTFCRVCSRSRSESRLRPTTIRVGYDG